MREVYSLGIIGWPLQKSLSPLLHQAAMLYFKLDGEYHLYPVKPLPDGADTLQEMISRVKEGRIQGLNVTIPHKLSVINYLDCLTAEAQAIGAVNTIFLQNGKLWGDNTDATGFIRDLNHQFPELLEMPSHNRLALVLGAGGAARAVVYSLIQSGFKVTIVSRQPNPQLISDFGIEQIKIIDWFELINQRSSFANHLIVNATPVGMYPDSDICAWPEVVEFPTNVWIYDLVYKPVKTQLVRRALRNGLPAVSGLGMLVEQAALAFERWTTMKPPTSVLWESIANASIQEK